jgi:hypothetical protein
LKSHQVKIHNKIVPRLRVRRVIGDTKHSVASEGQPEVSDAREFENTKALQDESVNAMITADLSKTNFLDPGNEDLFAKFFGGMEDNEL